MGNRMDELIQSIQDRINVYKDGLINDVEFISNITELTDEYIEDKISGMEEEIENLRGMMSYDR
jgi:hypothetical protein